MMDLITAERSELVAVLDNMSDAQWNSPSLCDGWSVAHVAAHLTMPFRISPEEFQRGMAAAGGQFTDYSDAVASRDSKLPKAELVAALRDNVATPWQPPGGGLEGAMSHDLIHGLDMTWPLSITYPIPDRALATVLDLTVSAGDRSLFGFATSGIQLTATDLEWSSGSGKPLFGPSRNLLLLIAGRRIPSDSFTGDGVHLIGASVR